MLSVSTRLLLGALALVVAPLACAAGDRAPSARAPLASDAAGTSVAIVDAAARKAPALPLSSARATVRLEAEGPTSAVAEPSRPPPPARGTAVLHVGDSFVRSGLAQALERRLSPLGVRYAVHAQQSTNSLDWAKRIGPLVQQYDPDLVIVTLGGNEIASKHVAVQARAVERIVAAIGARPCVWTTPPLWREEEGLFDAIRTHLKPCRYFETDLVLGRPIARRADGIHPTPEGGEAWAAALWGWLEQERRGTDASWALREAPDGEYVAQGRRKPLSGALEPVARHP
jgi:hypothetical protein